MSIHVHPCPCPLKYERCLSRYIAMSCLPSNLPNASREWFLLNPFKKILQVNGSWNLYQITHETYSKNIKKSMGLKTTKLCDPAGLSSWSVLDIPFFKPVARMIWSRPERSNDLNGRYRLIAPKWSNSPTSCCSSSVMRSGWSVPCHDTCEGNWFHHDFTMISPELATESDSLWIICG